MQRSRLRNQPFSLAPLGAGWPASLAALVRNPLESLLRLDDLNATYQRAVAPEELQTFPRALLAQLAVAIEISDDDMARIPTTGPLIVVANHPFGIVEGLVMAAVLESVRWDSKIMVNRWLACIPEAHQRCIFVDTFDSRASRQANVRGLRESMAWLKRHGALGIFPAGEVAHWDPTQRRVIDPPWNEAVIALARKNSATVLPMYFAGSNGPLFQMAGLIHPRLRTALLPREFLNKRDRRCTVHIGPPITPDQIAGFEDDRRAIEFVRFRTEALAGRLPPVERKKIPLLPLRLPGRKRQSARARPLAAPVPRVVLEQEIGLLDGDALLASAGDLDVWLAEAWQVPHLMLELGLQRERTFRGVGEGTGQPLDLDRFDRHYQQLLVWDRRQGELVGGYRLGLVDQLRQHQGGRGLYISTLFDVDSRFFDELGPAIELGRSFVRPEYQKSFAPLMLLWKGIGQFIAQRPQYRYLLGPVSISNQYRPLSRALLVTFLSQPARRAAGYEMVRPKRRFDPRKVANTGSLRLMGAVGSIDELNRVIADIEPDGKGAPVLLRQYVKMGARALDFNVDPAFGHCVDGLCVLDLLTADRRTVRRYFGEEQLARFLAVHHHTEGIADDSHG
jgi:putative hemolysin